MDFLHFPPGKLCIREADPQQPGARSAMQSSASQRGFRLSRLGAENRPEPPSMCAVSSKSPSKCSGNLYLGMSENGVYPQL